MNYDPSVFYVCTRPKTYFQDRGYEEHYLWHARALGIDPKNFEVCYLPDQRLPANVEADLVIIGGSNKSVYDTEPWIQPLEQFIVRLVQEKKPMFGVCFGHQIIAQALGGTVEPGSFGPEIGLTEIELTKDGLHDPLFKNITPVFDAMQLHKDIVVKLPPVEVVVLANSDLYPNQALAYGDHVRTVQFHPEITTNIMETEVNEHADEMLRLGYFSNKAEIERKTAALQDNTFESTAQAIYRNFLKMI
ncbi:MAG: type 1 glutamine amidotransferase [Patescibacteria group bacterium]